MTARRRYLKGRKLEIVISAILTASVAVGVMGCGKEEETPAPATKQVVQAGPGKIIGVVTFDGVPPAPRLIPEAAAAKCHDSARPVYDDSLVVNAQGGIKNVVVYIENGPNVELPSTRPAVLDQTSCQYSPHVLAVRSGTPMTLRSSDPIQHNVHASRPAKNRPFSLPFTAAGQEKPITLVNPEFSPPIEIRCDVHQWMRAYVAVFDHPFFAVTDVDGKYEIKGLPKGQYTLVAWHEKYPAKRMTMVIDDSDRAAAENPHIASFQFGK